MLDCCELFTTVIQLLKDWDDCGIVIVMLDHFHSLFCMTSVRMILKHVDFQFCQHWLGTHSMKNTLSVGVLMDPFSIGLLGKFSDSECLVLVALLYFLILSFPLCSRLQNLCGFECFTFTLDVCLSHDIFRFIMSWGVTRPNMRNIKTFEKFTV